MVRHALAGLSRGPLLLAACLIASGVFSVASPHFATVDNLLTVLRNSTELLLVGLGLYLIARRDRPRDGVMLLALEAIFLADVGFLASEAYQESLTAGLLVSGVLLALGAAKLVAIFRTLLGSADIVSALAGLS